MFTVQEENEKKCEIVSINYSYMELEQNSGVGQMKIILHEQINDMNYRSILPHKNTDF